MSISEVLVLVDLEQDERQRLEALNPGANYVYAGPRAATKEMVDAADVIFGNAPAALVSTSSRLKWMQLWSAGSDAYQKAGAFPAQATLTNATGSYGLAIAEHMLAMTFALAKRLHQYRDNQPSGIWRDEGEVFAIEGSTTLVLGLGDIGGEFARRMKALGSRVIGVRRTNAEKPDFIDELFLTGSEDALLPRADIIAMALPNTAQTAQTLSRRRIALLKKNAVVINVGRGSAIDQDALCDALDAGLIWGAGLDVTDPEPLPREHRLWKTRNALITPHISGGDHLAETWRRIFGIMCENYGALLQDRPLRNVVDFARGY